MCCSASSQKIKTPLFFIWLHIIVKKKYNVNSGAIIGQDEASISYLFINSIHNIKLVKLLDQLLTIPYLSKCQMFMRKA